MSSTKSSNQLLRVLILVSLFFHTFLLMYITGIYRPKATKYIELTLKEYKITPERVIPKMSDLIQSESIRSTGKVSRMAPAEQSPGDNQSLQADAKPVTAGISDIATEQGSGDTRIKNAVNIGHIAHDSYFSPGKTGGGTGMATREGYLEMVRKKLDENYRYPDVSDTRAVECVVIVSFIINLDGTIRNLKILKPGPYPEFDRQALQTVKNSAPFLKPPPYIFTGDIPYLLTLYFNVNTKTTNLLLKGNY